MKLSALPYTRASWPFGRGAVIVWKGRERHGKGVRAVNIPIDDATPRHDPVMVPEILADLALKPGDTVLEGTVGLGGHSREMIAAIAPGGRFLGTEWDASMLSVARERLREPEGVAIEIVQADFRDLPRLASERGLRANGMLFDLGLNSAQVDDPSRGFSFREEGALDMRMDRSSGEPAAAFLNRMTPGQLEEMIRDLGDERWARAIAKQVVERRKARPLKTTQDLVECVLAAIPPGAREKRIHPATRTFQAVRIYVNGELEGLETALRESAEVLAPGGTLCVLSYHSGEDRIAKRVFRDLEGGGFAELHRRPLEASEAEVRQNPRSRSAKLRSLRRDASSLGSESRAALR